MMYLKNIIIQNYGPLRDLQIDLPFDKVGNPRPLILVGLNGSGKSLTLSVILDALISMRQVVYADVPEIKKDKLFKPLRQTIRTHGQANFSRAECSFSWADGSVKFTELVSGIITDGLYPFPEDFVKPDHFETDIFNRHGLSKSLSIKNKDILRPALIDTVLAYFPAGRAESPGWLSDESPITFNMSTGYVDNAAYSLWRSYLVESVSNWVLDVVLDAELYDVKPLSVTLPNGNQVQAYVRTDGKNRKVLKHLNEILTQIICGAETIYSTVRLGVSQRSGGGRQIQVCATRKDDGNEDTLAFDLKDLSTGELSIFCMFADIIRLAESQEWDGNDIGDVSGIALIDEVDLHLHIKLQKEILSKLFAMFPKVQFILTTHSPFFVLGSTDISAEIRSLPLGQEIQPEEFSEFDEAYQVFVDQNQRYKSEYENLKTSLEASQKPLIVTEGKTDWKHLKYVLERFQADDEFLDIDVTFHELEASMGNGELKKLYEASVKLQPSHPVVFLFDCDEKKYIEEFSKTADDFKINGKAIGMYLAVPEHRKETPEIYIEHLYTDEALQTCLPDTKKRLRFKHEIGFEANKKSAFIKPTPSATSIEIYDQDVATIGNEDGTNKGELAISKNCFLEEIVKKAIGTNFDLSGFKPTLERIRAAIAKINDK